MKPNLEWQQCDIGWRVQAGPVVAHVFFEHRGWFRTVIDYGGETIVKAYRGEMVAKYSVLDVIRKRLREVLNELYLED